MLVYSVEPFWPDFKNVGSYARAFTIIWTYPETVEKQVKRLIQQQTGNVSWRRRAQIKQLPWPMAERQIEHGSRV